MVILLSRKRTEAGSERGISQLECVQHVRGQRAEQGPGVGCVTWDTRVGFIAEVRVEGGWGASNVTVSGDNIPGRGVSKRG